MLSKQQHVRERIVSFVSRHKDSRDDWRVYTVNHFTAEGVPRRTVYRILARFQATKSVKRLKGSGRPSAVAGANRQLLRRAVNNRCGVSQNRISPKGMSTPVLTSGRDMSVTADTYVNKCLRPHLLPFINTHYSEGGYVFWPDKASAHYATSTLNFLRDSGVNFVAKEDNPTETPQVRPIEDFFGVLATNVYQGDWVAKDTEALKRRIQRCLERMPEEIVNSAMEGVRRRLGLAGRHGLFSVCH